MRSLTVRNSFQISIAVSLLVHMAVIVLLSSITPREAGRPRAYFVDIVEEKPPPPPRVERPLPLVEEIPAPLEKPAPFPEEKSRPKSMFNEDEVTEIPPQAVREAGEDLSPSGEVEEKGAGKEPVPPRTEEGSEARKLFDKKLIQEFAQKSTEEEKAEDKGITFDTEEFKYQGYMERLKEKIEAIWVYPKGAAQKGIYGDLLIRFVIKKDGTLGSVNVLRTSGYSILDEFAVRALRDGEPYWPLPDGWGQNSLTVTGHFTYTIYGVHVR